MSGHDALALSKGPANFDVLLVEVSVNWNQKHVLQLSWRHTNSRPYRFPPLSLFLKTILAGISWNVYENVIRSTAGHQRKAAHNPVVEWINKLWNGKGTSIWQWTNGKRNQYMTGKWVNYNQIQCRRISGAKSPRSRRLLIIASV